MHTMICSLARSVLSNRYSAKFDALLLWQISDVYRRRGEVGVGRGSVSGRQLLLSYVHICPSSGIIV